jgi:hypothetical protein
VNIRHKNKELITLLKAELPIDPRLETQLSLTTAPRKETIICCKSCMTLITKNEFSISIDGHHEHMQCNPHGLTFIFRCFNYVENCSSVGTPCEDFSWFKGHTWTLTLCSHCGEHLGWSFAPSSNNLSESQFWGLISTKLTEMLQG